MNFRCKSCGKTLSGAEVAQQRSPLQRCLKKGGHVGPFEVIHEDRRQAVQQPQSRKAVA